MGNQPFKHTANGGPWNPIGPWAKLFSDTNPATHLDYITAIKHVLCLTVDKGLIMVVIIKQGYT